MYGSKDRLHKNVKPSLEGLEWLSKNDIYERPLNANPEKEAGIYKSSRPIAET